MRHIKEKAVKARLRFRPPIKESELAEFETRAGVALPNDYRRFLTTVGNGGLGRNRLLPLDRWHWCYWIDDPPLERALTTPSIVSPDNAAAGEKWLDTFAEPDWEAKWESDQWDPMFGTIAVAETGCGLFFSLVISGPCRGRVFSYGDNAANPPWFGPELGFLEWIEAAMDRVIHRGPDTHFLDGRAPGI